MLAAIDEVRQHVPVQVRAVRYSLKELRTTQDRIGHDADRWRTQGIDIVGIGSGGAENRVSIDLRHYTPAAEQRLKSAYGDMVIVTRADVDASGEAGQS